MSAHHAKGPLHLQAAAGASGLLALLGLVMFALVHHHGTQTALEATQRLNLGLARYVVAHLEGGMVDRSGHPDGRRMTALAQQVMMINPAVEVYLLSTDGQVLAHALDGELPVDPIGRRVDMAPVQRLSTPALAAPRLPVLGDDPRRPGQRTIVSVAPVADAGTTTGYMYIVLHGQALRTVAGNLADSQALRELLLGLVLVTAMAAGVLALALRRLTRPLRQLAAELDAFRTEPGTPGSPRAQDELGVLRMAIAALQQRVGEQFARLEQADSQRRELISSISHDLRTPLSNIRGYVETVLLRGDGLAVETRAQHLRTALRHTDLLNRRVRDLFELSKLDAGRQTPRQDRFCLAELLQDVVQNYQLPARHQGVAIAMAANSLRQARVTADIAMIERVLQNLIDNALRFTAAGGQVTLVVTASGAQYAISVTDTGRGIPAEHLPHIFDRYWRAGPDEEMRAGTSSGLGLAIVKRILELHGSAVRVTSALAQGTRVEFALPLAA
ncbi:MAG: two-component sensor histidine kinase [Alphaproteobacteria bacterium PA3]|nr:MAG: two-component sensor histidine kinase [Alphaproteobacteria bacterium PA3]